MKKILSLSVLLSSFVFGFAQNFQASIQPLPGAAAGVTVFSKTSVTKTGKVSSLTITIAIPVSVGPRPAISVDNSANTFIGYDIYNAVNQPIAGVPHYIWNVLGTGDVVPAGASRTFTAGVDVPMAVINFAGLPGLSSQIKMASLPNGGDLDPNPNSYFGLSIDGADVVNENAMFYGIPANSTASNDGQGYSGTSFAQTIALVPLPVRFLGFDALKKNNNADLTWKVANESVMTDHYEIERGFTANTLTMLASVPAKNNGNSSNVYTSADLNLSALRSSGKIYYRIKQVDKDGKFIYSETRLISLDGKTFDVSVYPNPAVNAGDLYIDLAKADKISIKLTDAAGKLVVNASINGINGLNKYSLNMAALAKGTYNVTVQSGTERKTLQIVKN